MKKKVIIFSHYVDNDNNYLQYTHSQAKQFNKMGYDVIVFAPKGIKSLKDLFSRVKVSIIDEIKVINSKRIPFGSFLINSKLNINGLFYYLSIRKKVRNILNNGDVLFLNAHNFHCEGYAAYLFKKKYNNIKVTITFHGSDLESELSNKNSIDRLVKVSKVIDYYVCVSDKLTNKLKNINISNVKTIYNGFENYELPEVQKEKIFITVADLIKLKNIDILIDAFSIIFKKYDDYKLKIVGDGPLKSELLTKVKKYNLEDKIYFTGMIPNKQVFNELNKAFCFILTSSPEGFGIVYLEAMNCKCITIGTKGEGIDGFIKNGQNGFLVNINANEIANLVLGILNNKYDLNTVINNGYISAKQLTWERNVKEYVELVKY